MSLGTECPPGPFNVVGEVLYSPGHSSFRGQAARQSERDVTVGSAMRGSATCRHELNRWARPEPPPPTLAQSSWSRQKGRGRLAYSPTSLSKRLPGLLSLFWRRLRASG